MKNVYKLFTIYPIMSRDFEGAGVSIEIDHELLTAIGARFVPVQNKSIDRILAAVREHLGAEIAFVSRYTEGGMKQLTHVNSDIELPMGPGFVDPREDSYCWHIAEGRLPELIQDIADFPFTQTMSITNFLPVGCHVNTPLRLSDGTLYGSFCCLSRTPDRSLGERDVGVLRAFAELAIEQIEMSIENDDRRSALEAAIGGVLTRQAITIFHQPIVTLADGRLLGVECLARFADAALRGPDKWFDEAAEIGRGIELELLAIRLALETRSVLSPDAYLSINASPETILSGELENTLASADRTRLVLEVTEHQQIGDFTGMRAALQRLSSLARIAIDDVGAGYAGLRHLVDLGPDLLKLDMTLTRDVHRDPARRALVGAMVSFAREIGAKLVAEGIECMEEQTVLVDLGVDYGQGYFFGKPAAAVPLS